jgi:hypothetical protein
MSALGHGLPSGATITNGRNASPILTHRSGVTNTGRSLQIRQRSPERGAFPSNEHAEGKTTPSGRVRERAVRGCRRLVSI